MQKPLHFAQQNIVLNKANASFAVVKSQDNYFRKNYNLENFLIG